TTWAPLSTSASPSPVRVLTPVLGAAATASYPRALSFAMSFDPIRPVPPITTIFISLSLQFFAPRLRNRILSVASSVLLLTQVSLRSSLAVPVHALPLRDGPRQ